jgi:hypothetical protein
MERQEDGGAFRRDEDRHRFSRRGMQIKNLSFTAPDTSFLTNGSRSYNIAVSLVVFAQLIVNWLLTSIGNILTAGMDRRIRDK